MGTYKGIAITGETLIGVKVEGSSSIDNTKLGGTKATMFHPPGAIKTANFTVGDNDRYIVCNGSGALVATLPDASLWPGREIYIKTIANQKVDSASSNVKPIGTDTAGVVIVANTAGKAAMIVSDGTVWVKMMAN
jgi:hypothetical protein